MRTLARALAALFLIAAGMPAAAQGLQDFRWEVAEFAEPGGPVAFLAFAVPETDNALLHAECPVAGGGPVAMTLYVDPGPTPVGGQTDVTFRVGDSLESRFARIEEGPFGPQVAIDLPVSDSLWTALMDGQAGQVAARGGAWANFHLSGSGTAISRFLERCRTGASPGSAAGDSSASPPAARQREYFRDYLATCRTDGSCDTATFTETPTLSGGTFMSSLTLKRAGFPGTAWILSFSGAFEGPVPGTPILVEADGRTWTLGAGQGYGDIMGHNYFHWPANEEILQAMRSGRQVSITQTIEGGGQQTVRYSTLGLTAAMDWIDRLQGRSGERPMIGVPTSLEEIVPGYQP